MKRSKTVLMVLLPLATGFAAAWLWMSARHGAGDGGPLSQLEQENRILKATVEELRSSRTARPDVPGGVQNPRTGRPPGGLSKNEPAYADYAEAIRTLRENLSAANQSATEWQARAAERQNHLDQLADEQKRFNAVETTLTERVASANQEMAAKEAELGRKNDQLLALEAANKKLREGTAVATQKTGEMSQAAGELQELYRRRESSLSTLIGRYREVTEQYRAFASVLENRRGPEGTAGAGISIAGPELARIQNTITLAEEDLRQLNALNAQALRVQKKLSGK